MPAQRASSRVMRPSSLARALGPLMLLFSLLGAGLLLTRFWSHDLESPSPIHRSSKGSRLDPWRPMPGCISLQGDDARPVPWLLDPATAVTCQSRPSVRSDAQASGMGAGEQRFGALLRAINPIRSPLQTDSAVPMNQIERDGRTLPTGADIHLTLQAKAQARADKLLSCLTGHLDACPDAGIAADTWQHHYESAAMRSGALLVMDISTGRIEVAASSHSSCYEAEEGGQPLHSGCPPSARAIGVRQWKLANAALFSDEMPGSLVKLPIMLSLLRHNESGPVLLEPGSAQDKFIDDIRRSETANFLDRLFCKDRAYRDCARLTGLAQAATDLGWNQPPDNLLALADMPRPAHLNAPSARFMRAWGKADGAWREMQVRYKPLAAQRCGEQAMDRRWSKCRDETVANLVAELWGQGNARTSPLAVAVTLSRLAAAANGQARIGAPHLLDAVEGSLQGTAVSYRRVAEVETKAIASDHAQLILKGMGLTHQPGGTAFAACLHALDNTSQAIRACAQLQGVAGKTGTPVFNHDRLSVTQRASHCAALRTRAIGIDAAQRRRLSAELTQCQVSPIKWYAAVLRDDPTSKSGPWTRVVVALAERNWRGDGRIDSAQDRGPNIAAEMAFRYFTQREENRP